MTFAMLLINTCTIERFTADDTDDYGNPTGTWAGTDEPCRLQAGVGRELKIGAEVVIADYKLFLNESADITERDRVVVDDIEYEVLLVAGRQGGVQEHHKECFMRVTR